MHSAATNQPFLTMFPATFPLRQSASHHTARRIGFASAGKQSLTNDRFGGRAKCLLLMLWTALHPGGSIGSRRDGGEHGSSDHGRFGYRQSVFQVYGVDEGGAVVVRWQVRRAQLLAFFAKLPACLIGIEARATGHHWARELIKLGHQVRLMPPSYVKPYVKRQKNDAANAEAICEAVTRLTVRFVEVKSPRRSDRVVTSQPGSASYPGRIQAAARNAWAVSPSRATGICTSCLSWGRWLSCAMRSGTEHGGHGWCSCWRAEQRRSRPSRWPTRLLGWFGPS